MPRSESLTPVVRWRTRLTREGRYWLAVSALLWITGVSKGINLVLLLAYAVISLGLLNWLIARRAMKGLRAKRLTRPPVFAGEPTAWEIEVTDQSRRPILGCDLIDQGPEHSLEWFIPELQSGKHNRLRGVVTPSKRGFYQSEPLRATAGYPFGLVAREGEFAIDPPIVVFPRIGTFHRGRLLRWLSQAARPDERAPRQHRKQATDAEFQGVRDYRVGDSPRWIHWKTSARHGELMVREFDQGVHHDLFLIIELYSEDSEDQKLEQSIELAATICWAWEEDAADRVTLAILGETPEVIAGDRFEQLSRLATARGLAEPSFSGLTESIGRKALPPGPALLISPRNATKTAEKIGKELGMPVAWIDANMPPTFYEPPSPREDAHER